MIDELQNPTDMYNKLPKGRLIKPCSSSQIHHGLIHKSFEVDNFFGEAEVIGKDTLNLAYTSFGGFC